MRGYRAVPGEGWDTAEVSYGTAHDTPYDTPYGGSYGVPPGYGAASTYRMPHDEPFYQAGYEPSFEAPYAAPDTSFEAPYFAPEALDGQDQVLDDNWDFDAGLAQLLQQSAADEGDDPDLDDDYDESAPPVIPRQRGARRRPGRLIRLVQQFRDKRPKPFPWLRVFSLVIAAATAAIVAMLSVLGGVISYDPLRRLASPDAPEGVVALWPLLVYGPWMVGSLSILRAAVHRRRAGHSWAVVIMFSAIAVYLCVAHAPRTVLGMAVAGLPPVTALVSFHQLVRQITLTNPPRHALPRQRHGRG